MSIPITQCMPSLRRLDIRSCERLSSLVGLDYCNSLQQLQVLISISYENEKYPPKVEAMQTKEAPRTTCVRVLTSYIPKLQKEHSGHICRILNGEDVDIEEMVLRTPISKS